MRIDVSDPKVRALPAVLLLLVGTCIAADVRIDGAAAAAVAYAREGVPVPTFDRFLKYPPIYLPQSGTPTPEGPQFATMAVALDPLHRGRQIFYSNCDLGSGLYGFEGASGAPLLGFFPLAGGGNGPTLPTAIATSAMRIDGTGILPSYSILDMHGTGIIDDFVRLRLIGPDGVPRWSNPSSNSRYGGFPFPPSSTGSIAADGSEDAVFLLDEEDYNTLGRSARSGDVVWQMPEPVVDQQIDTAAVVDLDADPSFVYCRGRVHCLLQKRRVRDGALQWSADLGENHIYPILAAGDIEGNGSERVVVIGRQDGQPFHALVELVDAANGHLLWTFDLGEWTSAYGPAPALADLDGDGRAEIVVQTETRLHVVRPYEGEAPGWPVTTSTVASSPMRSEPLVGDLDGDGGMEIVVQSNAGWTALDIFDSSGDRKLLDGTALFYAGDGTTPAIADVDDDGHNELLLGSCFATSPQLLPSVRVLDFSLGHPTTAHGAILWGQFGGDARHRSRALPPRPVAGYAPASVSAHVLLGHSTSERIAIGNDGAVDLSWTARVVAAGADAQCDGEEIPWAHVAEGVGRLSGGHEHVVDVVMDGIGLSSGAHSAQICISSNDAARPEMRIPVQLDVETVSHVVTTTVSEGGLLAPGVSGPVADGAVLRFEAKPAFSRNVALFEGCGGHLVGSELITEPVTSDCTITLVFAPPSDRIFMDQFEATP